jgi:hypothetical protein
MMRATTAALFATVTLFSVSAAASDPLSAKLESVDDQADPALMPHDSARSTTVDGPPTKRLCADLCGYEELFRQSTVGFGVAMGVSQIAEIDGINSRLAPAGYSELPAWGAHVAFSIPMSIDRFMFLTQIRFLRFGAPGETSQLDTYLGTFSFGYSLTPPEVLALYPFAGLGIGASELSLGTPGPAGVSFDDALRQGRGAVDLSTIGFVGTVGIAADYLLVRTFDHPTRGLFIGARTGMSVAFTHSDWSFGPEQGDVLDGPAAPMSGFYGEGALGLRF